MTTENSSFVEHSAPDPRVHLGCLGVSQGKHHHRFVSGKHYCSPVTLLMAGRPEEGTEEARQARRLDPSHPIMASILGFVLYLLRRYDEARSRYERYLEEREKYFERVRRLNRRDFVRLAGVAATAAPHRPK